MNAREQVSHDYITLFLEAAVQKRIGYLEVLSYTDPLLKTFRHRCPVCSTPVSFSPWVDELRAAKCGRCGHGWKEAPL